VSYRHDIQPVKTSAWNYGYVSGRGTARKYHLGREFQLVPWAAENKDDCSGTRQKTAKCLNFRCSVCLSSCEITPHNTYEVSC